MSATGLPISPIRTPGLFVTGTDTNVGKTYIAAAIAASIRGSGRRVEVLKPVATGCVKRREGLVSEDAELLAAASDTDQPLDLICPNPYAEPLAPSVAARRANRPVDYLAIERSVALAGRTDAWIIEGAGGVLTPLDDVHTIRDLIVAFGLPAIVVATPRLGTINHTLLSIEALRAAGIDVAGVVLNRYPTDTPGTAEETAAAEIERLGRVAVLAIVPDEPWTPPAPPPAVMSAIGRVDWPARLRGPG
ncbi:MAG TPA: dethiobiotin synthase [Tepidisphaeraceae bacterium]|jgi:dethiobiotin synthetase